MSDKTNALASSLLLAKGKTLMLTDNIYSIAGKIEVDMEGADIEISSRFGSKILVNYTQASGTFSLPVGSLHVTNARNVKITNIFLEGINTSFTRSAGPYQEGLTISNCKTVVLENVQSTKFAQAGIKIFNCDSFYAYNCNCSYNLFSGLAISNTKNIKIVGGEYSYNQQNFPADGYGITLSHRNGLAVDNSSIYIAGVKAWYNTRKGIDVHGGVGGVIIGNHVKGFGNGGIEAVNEAGSSPGDSGANEDWAKYVRDWIITGNIIENDLAWYNDQCTNAKDINGIPSPVTGFTRGADGMAIMLGAFGNYVTLDAGCFLINNNLIRNCNVTYGRGHIFAFSNFISPWNGGDIYYINATVIYNGVYYKCKAAHTNQTPPNATYWEVIPDGRQPRTFSICNNTITEASVPFNSSGDYDGVITVTGILHPKAVDLSGNIISGTSNTAIKCVVGEVVTVHNNCIVGTFTDTINLDYNLPQKTSGNTYNGKPLPDMVSKDNGSWEYFITTSGEGSGGTLAIPLKLDTIKVNAANDAGGGYNNGIINLIVQINATSYNLIANYEFNAYAGNNGISIITDAKLTRRTGVLNDPAVDQPALSWIDPAYEENSLTTSNIRVLRLTFFHEYTGNFISIKISGWRLYPKGA